MINVYLCITRRYPAVVALVLIIRVSAVCANAVYTARNYD